MKKVTEAIFSGYMNEQFDGILPEYRKTAAEKEFEKVWNLFNKKVSEEEASKNDDLKSDSDYESTRREFKNAFRLGFILCAEVFFGE